MGIRVGPGHRKGTTIAVGYNASNGHPVDTTATTGYSVNLSDGRTQGTTVAAAGYNVGWSGGHTKVTGIITPRACARGKVIGSVIVVDTKIT